jgi:hypothetical protein
MQETRGREEKQTEKASAGRGPGDVNVHLQSRETGNQGNPKE